MAFAGNPRLFFTEADVFIAATQSISYHWSISPSARIEPMESELDCRGLACPEPVTRCRALIRDSNPDAVAILVDNAAALENVSRLLTRNGYGAKSEKYSDNGWRIVARRSANAETETPVDPAPSHDGAKTLVLLTADTLGRGDNDLGEKLMAMFLGNLSELGESLWRIVLLNGAVKLSATAGDSLKALKALEASGISILVCGTCLNHYGLLEQKQVGQTTNMMDVITSLGLAQKIIRP